VCQNTRRDDPINMHMDDMTLMKLSAPCKFDKSHNNTTLREKDCRVIKVPSGFGHAWKLD